MPDQPKPGSPEEYAARAEMQAARVEMRYLSAIPKEVPPGRVVAHNHVRPARRLGERGFRAWTQLPEDRLVVCDCGWAPELAEHYRVAQVRDPRARHEG